MTRRRYLLKTKAIRSVLVRRYRLHVNNHPPVEPASCGFGHKQRAFWKNTQISSSAPLTIMRKSQSGLDCRNQSCEANQWPDSELAHSHDVLVRVRAYHAIIEGVRMGVFTGTSARSCKWRFKQSNNSVICRKV